MAESPSESFRRIFEEAFGIEFCDDLADTPCPDCGMKGLQTILGGKENSVMGHCANCDWHMYVKNPERCPDCDGAGTVPELLVARGASKRGTVPCPQCGGEGTL